MLHARQRVRLLLRPPLQGMAVSVILSILFDATYLCQQSNNRTLAIGFPTLLDSDRVRRE